MGALQHDTAAAIAASVVDVFAPLLREEEKKEAFQEVYLRVKAGLAEYERKADRIAKRLKPLEN